MLPREGMRMHCSQAHMLVQHVHRMAQLPREHGAVAGMHPVLQAAKRGVALRCYICLGLRGCSVCGVVQLDNARREDRAHRSLDYDSHLGLERDPITREITQTASHT